VREVVTDLRIDLALGNIPFVAGELLYGESGHNGRNDFVNDLPNKIPNAFVVSADGLTGVDIFHFTAESYRLFGIRYGETMMSALSLSRVN
jgi:hypothetical protein